MNIPSQITAGDSLAWDDAPATDNLGNTISSANGWTLKYHLRNATQTLDLTAAAQGDGWRTAITSAQSTTFGAGDAYWSARATKAAEAVTLGSGKLEVLINRQAASAGAELRSQAKQDLAAVQAAMRAIISGGAVAEYTIGNRSLRKLPMEDLIMLESRLKAAVVREEKAEMIANGKGNPNNLYVRFNK